jgi:hypothetical protein
MVRTTRHSVARDFDPDRLAGLELRMWKAYYRRQPARLFGLLVQTLREQGHASWPRALGSAVFLTKGAVGFAQSCGDDARFAPEIARGYRVLGLPADIDLEEVARWEMRWWVVRRELGVDAGAAAGDAITNLYAAFYGVPPARVAEAGRLRGMAAEVRDRGALADPDGPTGPGRGYWPEVARLLRASYRSLLVALRAPDEGSALSVAPADDPPREREEPARDEELEHVADQERHDALAQSIAEREPG